MNIFSRLSSSDVDRLIDGKSNTQVPELDVLAEEIRVARYALTNEAPDEITQARHLEQISEAVKEKAAAQYALYALAEANGDALDRGRQTTDRGRVTDRGKSLIDRGKRVGAVLGASVVAVSGSMVGLAYAGVDLPGSAADRAFEVVGVHLPNQHDEEETTPAADDPDTDDPDTDDPDTEDPENENDDPESQDSPEGTGAENEGDNGKSVSAAVHAIQEAIEDRGCEFGKAISEAASQNRQGDGGSEKDQCDRSEHTSQASDNGVEHSTAGKAKADENRSADHGKKGGAEEVEADEVDEDSHPGGGGGSVNGQGTEHSAGHAHEGGPKD